MGQDSRQRVAVRLLGYIGSNPFTGSTIEELTGWWQGLERVDPDMDLVTEVLETLVEEEKIERWFVEDDLFCYRRVK